MRDLILNTIFRYWTYTIFPNISMSRFFTDIYKFLTLLDFIDVNNSLTIAIHSKRSKNWIALYLACFIKGVSIVILSPNLDRKSFVRALNFTNVGYLFTQQKLLDFRSDDMLKIPFLKGAYDIDMIHPLTWRTSVHNINIPHQTVHNINHKLIDITAFKRIVESYKNNPDEIEVINLTSGVSHLESKFVVTNSNSILHTVTAGKYLLPFDDNNTVYSEVEFAHSHVVSVLLPFIAGCAFTDTQKHCNIIIESTNSFEKKWDREVDFMFESKTFYWLFKKRIFKNLFEKIAGKWLQDYYKGVEHIIVYNGNLHERLLNVAKKYLPLHVTYGSQEANQLVASNDFSCPAFNIIGSIGRTIGVISTNDKGELKYRSHGVFDYYLGDDGHTNYIKHANDLIRLSDQGYHKDDTDILQGRMTSVYKDKEKNTTINLNMLERHFKGFPFIEECILVPWTDGTVYMIVRVNQRLVESHKMGWMKTTDLLNKYYDTLKAGLATQLTLSEVIIMPDKLRKSFDGKVQTSYYRKSRT